MKHVLVIVLLLGATAQSGLWAQKKNRFSIQTGLFHSFFDGSPIIHNVPNNGKRTPGNLFKGALLESKGIQYQRMITDKSSLSLEYMILNETYGTRQFSAERQSSSLTRNTKTVTITYSRKFQLADRFDLVCGVGANYRWGDENTYYYNNVGFTCLPPEVSRYHRNDLALNARVGLDYSPLKWLTVYSYMDLMAIVYSGGGYVPDNTGYPTENDGTSFTPGRHDLSFNFGIGFNF